MQTSLRDIHGLDPLSWWPLAPGWWLALVTTVSLVLLTWILVSHLIAYPPGSWRSEAHRALARLKRRFRREQINAKEAATELSELLRRIAIARLGRQHHASLTDQAWLRCLNETDHSSFDWETEGRLLLTLPYAPDDPGSERAQIDSLLNATSNLIAPQRRKKQQTVEAGND
ncbi:MAG: DUF4381 domain-containing protein [Candidatus Sedimenticola sp. 6PFRAG7]